MATDGLSRETAIIAKAPEEVIMTAKRTAMWSVGSVLISKYYFMPGTCSKGGNSFKNCEKCAG
jgi:hypothetical protein